MPPLLLLACASLHAAQEPLNVPPAWGSISDQHHAASAAASRRIYLIQDIHVDQQAQSNIASILDLLARRHGVTLVMVEGAEGDVNLDYAKANAGAAITAKAAEALLQKGLISGPEFLDLTAGYELFLWGIEDEALYEANYRAYLDAERAGKRLAAALAGVGEAFRMKAEQVFSEDLASLLRAGDAVASGRAALDDYVARIVEQSGDLGLMNEGHPVAVFHAALQAESRLDAAALREEQQALLALLAQQAPAEELAALAALQQGDSGTLAYYQRLLDLREKHAAGLPADQIRHAAAYAAFGEAVGIGGIWDEVRDSAARLADALARSDEERDFLRAYRTLEALERLAAMEWTPYDWRLRSADPGMIEELPERLAPLDQAGMDWEAAQADARDLLGFYAAAVQRNEGMAKRIAARMLESGAASAAVVAGGFHSEALRDLLGNEFAITVITPLAGERRDERLYDYVLKYKQGFFKQASMQKGGDDV